MRDGTSIESSHRIDAGWRAFDGHFPGAPVLPGAMLLAIVLREIERHGLLAGVALQVQQVKFLAPVGPGRTLRIRLDVHDGGVAFSAHDGDTLVARGQVAGDAEAA
ncbi:MAG TPA: hypothetical protein VLE94_10780 [Burkholderiaceae bacterium]|nr:hypothetical protein [Burkholderiaceae bacterium]